MLVPRLQTTSIYRRRKKFNLKRNKRYPGSRNISVCTLIIFYKLTFVSTISDRLLKSQPPLHILALPLSSFSAWGACGLQCLGLLHHSLFWSQCPPMPWRRSPPFPSPGWCPWVCSRPWRQGPSCTAGRVLTGPTLGNPAPVPAGRGLSQPGTRNAAEGLSHC